VGTSLTNQDFAVTGFFTQGQNIGASNATVTGSLSFIDPITNQQLAAAAKMSLRAFERQFLASFQLTSQKYLRKLRLRIASRALIYANESLSEVALSCGFADQSHFTREFHRHFGRTPRDYRKHYKTVTAVSGTKSAVPKQ
jgi:AraC-like DNA-binding protein